MDKTAQIINASTRVFTKKGYQQATTSEIAKEANVAEVTLFRKFQSKKNLFDEVVKHIFQHAFLETKPLDVNTSFEDFFTTMIDQKLQMISQNHSVVRMLITELLADTLPEEFSIIQMIHQQIKQTVQDYFEKQAIKQNPEKYTEIIVGLLLRYAIIDHKKQYHKLTIEERTAFISYYLQIIKP